MRNTMPTRVLTTIAATIPGGRPFLPLAAPLRPVFEGAEDEDRKEVDIVELAVLVVDGRDTEGAVVLTLKLGLIVGLVDV
jgi:hypothetical protein